MQGLYWSKMVWVCLGRFWYRSGGLKNTFPDDFCRILRGSLCYLTQVSQSSVRSCQTASSYPSANNWDWRLEIPAWPINQTKWHNVAVEPLTPFCLRYPSQTARRTGLRAELHDWITMVGIPLHRILDILSLFLEAPPSFENCHWYHPVLKPYQIFLRWVAKQSIIV